MKQPDEQRGQEVHGPQTDIGGDVYGSVLSGHFDGPVSVYSRSQLEALKEYLAHAVAAYEARMLQHLRLPTAPPEQPYKFLYAFEIEDAPIFFGRDAASVALHETVLQDRMTVLHAKSGAGKTSLLKAGLAPQFIREGRLPVYARAYEDPVLAIKRAIAPPSVGPWPELLKTLSLHTFLGLVCQHLSRQTQELIIMLDQLEEFFVFWPAPEHRRPFVEALTSCYEDESLPVRIIIGIRGDYFTRLATFQDCLPHIFHNEYYLGTMTREETQAAITGPVTRLDRAVTYAPDLLDTLLDDLAQGGVELPHLQIICTQLYAGLSKGSMMISLAAYAALGGAAGILGGYLNGVLDKLPPSEQGIAREVLKELVSSEATKRVLPFDRLQARLGVEPGELRPVLAYLVDERLLQRDEDQDGPVYEMAHEYLIGEIKTWIDQESLAFKQAQELLEREMVNWRLHNTLIPRDRLEVLYAQREQFNQLSEEDWKCIINSALRADFAVEEWAGIAGERAVDSLLIALDNPDEEIRKAAIRGLATARNFEALRDLAHTDSKKRTKAAKRLKELGDVRAVEPLTIFLSDEDGNVRRETANALGRIGDVRAVAPLIAVLDDEDRDVRWGAANALGRIGDVRAMVPLISLLSDEYKNVREGAAHALGCIGKPAVDPLISLLGDEDKNVREGAAHALGCIGKPAVVSLISLLDDEDKAVRQGTANVLGRIGDARAVTPLIAALGDEDGDVRQVTIEALRNIGESAVASLISVLSDEDGVRRQGAASALGKIGDARAVEPLIVALDDEDEIVRQGAVYALGKIGDTYTVNPLIAALDDEDRDIRWGIAHALGNIGDVHAVMPLIAALRDEDWTVRFGAARALGKISDARAVEPLIAVLDDEDKAVRRQAVEALRKIGKPAVEPLIAALGDEHSGVKGEVAYVLGGIGDARAVEPLIGILEDKVVRRQVVEALRKIGEPAVDPLIAALGDKTMCRMAINTLSKIGKPAVDPLITALGCKDGKVRRCAAEALESIGDTRAVEPLIAALADEEKEIRWRVTIALGVIGDTRAVDPLITVLIDEDSYVRQMAADALESIGGPAVTPLIALLGSKDRDVRRKVIDLLGNISDTRAVGPLLAILGDEDRDVRREAANALKRIGTPEALAALIGYRRTSDAA